MRTSFVTSADGTRLRVGQWGDGARDVLLIHGLAEHAARYAHVGEAFAAAGFTATVVELRGHGHSGGRRGHVGRWQEYVEDVRAVAASLRPGFCMLGHSMGGLVALDSVREGLRPARLALSNPLLGVAVKLPGWKVSAAGLLSTVYPTLPMKNEIDPDALSRDPEVGRAYLSDPLVFQTATPRWYTEMLAALGRVHAVPRWEVPLAFFIGDADRVVDPVVGRAFAERVGARVSVYAEHRHELFNEIDKERVIADTVAWLGESPACASA